MKIETKITAKIGETFKVGKYEFIRFPDAQSGVAVVCKDILFNSAYGKNNNLSESDIMVRLSDVLAEIEAVIGIDNVLEFETDLTSMDGSRKHGQMRSKISLPTFDFYREKRPIFEKYKLDDCWWLATPWETSEYATDNWIACVAPSGDVGTDVYDGYRGVRPFSIFSSSIFEF